MNIENRATKLYLKELPPLQAIDFIEKYKIPSPYKEVLLTACVERKEGFRGIDYLAEKYNINIQYRTFVRKLKEALEMFRRSHIALYRPKDGNF
ncbi:MAG: hypothetical protein IJ184_03150 [Alphaproteobacteria bacterium]|nr:hypothetical protein [Alphaproteobacteria bacterium]